MNRMLYAPKRGYDSRWDEITDEYKQRFVILYLPNKFKYHVQEFVYLAVCE